MENGKRHTCGGKMELPVSNKCLKRHYADINNDVEIDDKGNGVLIDTKIHNIL